MTPFGTIIDDAKPLVIDLDYLMRGRLLLTASSGGGKTVALLRLCEQFAGKVQIIAFDPEGEFAVLRQKFPFVLVGPEGETPAMVRTAGLLAHRLLELGASAVLDIYELPMHEKHLFVKEFLDAMIAAPKNLWRPVIVIVDEAHLFAPEKGSGESIALNAMADLASRGRKRGYCAVLATQRLARLSKNVAAECQNVLIGRTTQVDQARACDVLNISGKAQRDNLARELGHLPTGDFFAYGLAFHRELPTRFTVGKPETMPKVGAKRLQHVPPPPDAIRELLPKLADLPAEAETKAKTEADLRLEIKELKRKLATAPTTQTIAPEREKMLLETINTLETGLDHTRRVASTYEKAMGAIYAQAGKMQDAAMAIKSTIEEVRIGAKMPVDAPVRNAAPTLAAPAPRRSAAAPVASVPRQKVAVDPPEGKISGPEQKILNSLAWFEAIGVANPEPPAIAFMAGYTLNGSFYNAKGQLKARGFVVYGVGGMFTLTDEGRQYAAVPDVELTNDALQTAVLSRLGGPEQKLLRPLIANYPNPMDGDNLAAAAGYTKNGSFFNARGKLRTLGLVSYVGGETVANALLFPEGE
jgi:hypothetical protein